VSILKGSSQFSFQVLHFKILPWFGQTVAIVVPADAAGIKVLFSCVSTAALTSILSMLQCAFLGSMQPSCTGGKSRYFHGCYICVHVTQKECYCKNLFFYNVRTGARQQ
jgi:hypothetical protein